MRRAVEESEGGTPEVSEGIGKYSGKTNVLKCVLIVVVAQY